MYIIVAGVHLFFFIIWEGKELKLKKNKIISIPFYVFKWSQLFDREVQMLGWGLCNGIVM